MKNLLQTIAKASTRRVTFSGGPPEEGEEIVGMLTPPLLQFYVVLEREKDKANEALATLSGTIERKNAEHIKSHEEHARDLSACVAHAEEVSKLEQQLDLLRLRFDLLMNTFFNMVRLELEMDYTPISITVRDGGQIAVVRKPAEEEFNPLHALISLLAGAGKMTRTTVKHAGHPHR